MAHTPLINNPFYKAMTFPVRKKHPLVVAYVAKRIRETGKGVTLQDIGYNFGWSNRVTPYQYVRRLESRGYLRRHGKDNKRGWGKIILAPEPPVECSADLRYEWAKTNLEPFYAY